MIITLKGADFSLNNINQYLTNWSISPVLNSAAATYNGVTSVPKDPATGLNATVTINDGYELNGDVTVTMGGSPLTSGVAVDGNIITIIITAVTGNVVITVPTKSTVVEPETPTNYVFTLNPTPTSATVTLSATGYSTVSGTGSKSITVANGTKVNWSVSADGYTEQNGNWTINGGNKIENITLTASSGGIGTTMVLNTLSEKGISSIDDKLDDYDNNNAGRWAYPSTVSASIGCPVGKVARFNRIRFIVKKIADEVSSINGTTVTTLDKVRIRVYKMAATCPVQDFTTSQMKLENAGLTLVKTYSLLTASTPLTSTSYQVVDVSLDEEFVNTNNDDLYIVITMPQAKYVASNYSGIMFVVTYPSYTTYNLTDWAIPFSSGYTTSDDLNNTSKDNLLTNKNSSTYFGPKAPTDTGCMYVPLELYV